MAAQVFLVGAGPGQADLLTLKAWRLLKEAEVVVYDRLVSYEVLDFIGDSAKRIYVGKSKGEHALSQEETNELLAQLARTYKTVVRLKGGDPLIFGRGGEEMLYLAERGIACEVVPGVSAASGVAAALQIPLTLRNQASGVRLITGHRSKNKAYELNWPELVSPTMTLVIYMGLTSIGRITKELLKHGLAPHTPAVAVENGTTERQRVCYGSVSKLATLLAERSFGSPCLILIGGVVETPQELKRLLDEAGQTIRKEGL